MNRMHRKKLSLAVMNALNAGVVVGLAAPMAYAQQTPPAEPAKIEKIEVTGSRIPLQTLESESPVNVITAQDIKYTGITNTSAIINQLPAAFADIGNMEANGASGTSTVNLRNLGSSRTLVLINGRRLPAGDVNVYATDLNAIPAPLIQRVDVLTGGASAVYGSDAVAGVVNFIMNDHFEGVEFSWNGNGYNHHQQNTAGVGSAVADSGQLNPAQYVVPGDVGLDGRTQDFSMTLGSNFAGGKGNATVYFEYKKADAVTQATRDFSACSIAPNDDGTGYICLGSSTSYPGRFQAILPTGKTSPSYTIADKAGNVRPYNGVTDAFNYGPYNYFQVPEERYIAQAYAHYDIDKGVLGFLPAVRVYSEFQFMDDTTTLQIAPSGAFFGNGPATIPLYAENPLLSQSFKDAFGITPGNPGTMLVGRRNIEGGGRQDQPRHTDYRFVIGGKGSVFDDKWDYNVWWQSGRVVYADTYLNDMGITRVLNATDVITDPKTGQPACRVTVNGTDPNCVPWNIFQLGGVTPAALNYLQIPGNQTGQTSQSVIGVNVDSDLGEAYGWRLPWARNGIGVAFGYERRTEKLSLETDTFFSVPEATGQGGPTIGLSGQYTVQEFYAEARVPIIEKQPFAEVLNVNGSYRYSNYSTDHTTNTYGLGFEWAPVKEGRLRGTYQQAVRAANIVELFTAQGINLFDMDVDPCGPKGSATLEQCLRTGLKPGQFRTDILDNPANQYNYLQGGNAALNPEKSKSYTVGAVLQPLPNLSGTIDYWHINVDNVVGRVGANLALNQCLDNGTFCDLVHRDPTLGTLWLSGGFITNLNQNLGSYKTDGIDVTVNYNLPIDQYGSLGFNFIGTWLNQFIVQPLPGGPSYDCAGLYGNTCFGPLPTWRSKLFALWNTPWNWNFGVTWRYMSSADIDSSSSNPQLSGDFAPVDGSVGAKNYFDLVAQWAITKNFTVRGGVNNVFDEDPPITSVGQLPFYNGNTFPQAYDTLGRNFFLNVTAKF